jgi:plastocyanin
MYVKAPALRALSRLDAAVATPFVAALMLSFALTSPAPADDGAAPTPVQIVALDECDPTTFNAPPVGPDFCKNVALAFLGFATTLPDLFAKAAAGAPDPNWDFEPDSLTIKTGTPLIVVNQGGEPHTFTPVANFGGGFIAGLNGGQAAVPECAAGFKDVAVARTRILQGSQLQVSGLTKGEHHFQCCIHPWMRVTVKVD